MELEVRTEVLKVVIVRQLVCDLSSQCDSCFVGPAPGHVAYRVAASAEQHEGQIVLLHELHALGVAFQGQVEAPETIPGEGVRAALKHDGGRLVTLHNL